MSRPLLGRLGAFVLLAALSLGGRALTAQQSALDQAAAALNVDTVITIEYSGSGSHFALGQSPNPEAPWPRFNLVSYRHTIDYSVPAGRQELVRTQGENPPRGGGGQPLDGQQTQIQLVNGSVAWNVGANNTPAPAAGVQAERLIQIRSTPHGFIKAARANKAAAKRSGPQTLVTFTADGRRYAGTLDANNLVEKIETVLANPVLGDMVVETTLSNYQDFGGVRFPSRIVQRQGGHPVLDLIVKDVKVRPSVDLAVPASLPPPPPLRVEVTEAAKGVWYITGGSHHSVAVEFGDHLVMMEGPQNEQRSEAVIAEVKKRFPTKPIRTLVNTHQHFDHSGGIRTYAAEGATIITHAVNKPYYEKLFAAGRTLESDTFAKSKRAAKIEAVVDRHVLSDGTRTLELHLIKGNPHNDALLMAYLPAEKILIEADAFNPAAPNAAYPTPPNPFTVNLFENIQRLKLNIEQILPIHGRLVPMAELLKAIGKGTSS